jgi:hypothetical protein
MQPTTRFHHGITKAILQKAYFVLHDPVALHPTNGVFNTNSDGGNPTIGLLLRRGQFPSRWCFLGLEDRNARQEKPLKALILIQATAGWQGIARQFGNALIRGFPFTGVAQETHVTGLIDHEEVFERVAFLLATVKFLLLLRVFRTLDGPFSPIVKKRTEGAKASVGGVVSIAAKSSAVRAGSSSWSAKA